MTREFLNMLQLAALGATGHTIPVDCTDVDWKKVVLLARSQRVDGYLAYALKQNRSLSCPGEILNPMLKEMRTLVFSNMIHRSAVVKLLEDLEAAQIRAVLLKGYAIADCYALPECRMSSDADLWVDPKDEDRACEFMKQRGFSVEPRWKNGHHAVCRHPEIGIVELHVILYDEIVEEVWFGRMDGSEFVTESPLQKETEDGKYATLGYTDHFIFLALHMIKHFIMSGLTVQMMFDVALYFRKYAEKIDVGRFWSTIKELHYDQAINCILWTMILYCGFSREDFPGVCGEAPAQIEEILADLEAGGWMGFTDKAAREQGWHEYNRQMMLRKKSKAGYLWHMFIWNCGVIKTALFPSAEVLCRKYPYAQGRPALIPVAWLHRLLFRGGRAAKSVLGRGVIIDESDIGSTAKKRIELFRNLKMM